MSITSEGDYMGRSCNLLDEKVTYLVRTKLLPTGAQRPRLPFCVIDAAAGTVALQSQLFRPTRRKNK